MANILIAEDDDSMRNFLALALEQAGHKVKSCADGLAALEALRQHGDIELLLSDIVMPGMDGIELSQKAAALRPNIKVLFITGFAAVAVDQKSKDAALQNAKILPKPFHLNELVQQVETLLAA